ncbi:hypothetical protein CYLTODRAFT_495007 [Cylindrobasidium torrendii FP15055 ss-10]|uniref:Protein kinase domain-containing protein n=1 Tax=Cylindrobasidium torrendii FP15055 ss-10 TaxID=1314674 RepID=A0A0D7AVG7_9AGAR|nr:hypothetical protein CYLTODRAFT_495007 [Cylindrobasidium torrendii FP15055 ss-10]
MSSSNSSSLTLLTATNFVADLIALAILALLAFSDDKISRHIRTNDIFLFLTTSLTTFANLLLNGPGSNSPKNKANCEGKTDITTKTLDTDTNCAATLRVPLLPQLPLERVAPPLNKRTPRVSVIRARARPSTARKPSPTVTTNSATKLTLHGISVSFGHRLSHDSPFRHVAIQNRVATAKYYAFEDYSHADVEQETLILRKCIQAWDSQFLAELIMPSRSKWGVHLFMPVYKETFETYLGRRAEDIQPFDLSRIFAELLLGVSAMHHKGIAYLNLPLSCVVLDTNQAHARITHPSASHTVLQGLAYISSPMDVSRSRIRGPSKPEMRDTQKDVFCGLKLDVYDLGLMMWRMTMAMLGHSCQRLDELGVDGKIYETVTTNDPSAWALLSEHPKTKGSALEELLRGCLDHDPVRRWDVQTIQDHAFFEMHGHAYENDGVNKIRANAKNGQDLCASCSSGG